MAVMVVFNYNLHKFESPFTAEHSWEDSQDVASDSCVLVTL